MDAFLKMKVGDFSETFDSIDTLLKDIQTLQSEGLEWYGKTATTAMKDKHDADAHEIQRYINRTYYLTTSIGYDVVKLGAEIWRLRMFAPPFYAEAVEYGTPRSRAYPFFWPAVYGFEQQALGSMTRAWLSAMTRQSTRVQEDQRRAKRR